MSERWRKLPDEEPADGAACLVWTPSYESVEVMSWDAGRGVWLVDSESCLPGVLRDAVHWMPMPEPPAEDGR